ncbi:M56 family metallopeptidase [Nocardia sp. 2YAB30]|uniref:M56 family metallopeptidase n=1 Tax=unclassified Nocardia TaxID=2637762 RepID=UPI003F95384C
MLLSFVTVDSLSLLSITTTWWNRGHNWEWFELCRLAVGYDPTQSYVPAEATTGAAFIESCDLAHGVRSAVGWTTAGSVAVFVLAVTLYLLVPTWRRRGGRLLSVDLDSSDELARQLRDLVAVAELRRSPAFAIDPRADTVGAVVFGRMGRYTVCLDAGLVAYGGADPAVLRDVVLHELAHIRNRDVDITYATVALWRAFLICALLPYLAGQVVSLIEDTEIWRLQWQLGLRGFIRAAVLVALTYLVRADILRTREIYADIDAAQLAGRTAFAWRDRLPLVRPTFVVSQRFLGLWRTHPGWSERSRSLTDPGIVFGATALPMFLTGVTAQVANVQTPIIFDDFQWSGSLGGVGELSTWTTAVLVVGIAGSILWRAVGYAVLTGRPVPSGWTAGVWLGVGMAVGELLSFRTAGMRLLPPDPEILIVFVISGPVFTWWVTHCAEIWIRGSRGRSLRPVQVFGLAAALVVFGTWYGYWMTGLFLLLRGPLRLSNLSVPGSPAWFWVVADLVNRPMVLVGASILWLFPLLTVVRGAVTQTPAWVERARTDTLERDTVVQGIVPVRPAVMGAAVGGGLCCVAVAVIMAGLHRNQPPPGEWPAEWIFRYPMWLSAGLGTVLMLTAIMVSVTAGRFRMMLALAASGGAGLFGLVGLFVFAAVDGCVAPLRVMAYTCDWRPRAAWTVVTLQVPFVLGLAIYVAAVAALLGALVVEGGRRLAGRRPGTAPHGEMSFGHRESVGVRRFVVVLTVGSVIGLIANTAINYYDRGEVEVDAVGALGLEPPRTSDTIARKVDAWLKVGGSEKINTLRDDFERLRTATADALRAAEWLPTVPIDEAVFVPLCAAIVRDADDIAAFIPIPDDRTQADSARYLDIARQAGSDCRRSFDDNDDALFNRSMTENIAATTAYEALLHRFEAIGSTGG